MRDILRPAARPGAAASNPVRASAAPRPMRRSSDRPDAEDLPAAAIAADVVLDEDFLRTATLGDPALRREILTLFRAQAKAAVEDIVGSRDPGDRSALAHRLAGAALGVGAFSLAARARAVEQHPAAGDVAASALPATLAATLRSIDALL